MSQHFSRSLFIDKLIPQFIREEYPLFVNFLKEYYNYLDRKSGQLVAVKVTNPGKNYTQNTQITCNILDNNPESSTYGEYIDDNKGAAFSAHIVNGNLEKILVTNYGGGYTSEDKVKIIIEDASGSGATAEALVIDSPGGVNETIGSVITSRDIDNNVDIFVEFLKNEFIPTFPQRLYTSSASEVEVTKFVKFIRQFYHSTGIEDSIRFLYRILFNAEVNFYYPKVDMLRVSAGRWQLDNVLRIYPAPSDITEFKNKYVGSRLLITGATGVATAILENAERVGSTGPHALLYLSTINGTISSTGGQVVMNYPITGATGLLGTTYTDGATGSFYSTNGHYIGDDGQLSSTKRIQGSPNIPYGASGALPYYYQEFSYELQSEESIRQFKGLLEDLVHPAGLVYFVRLNIEKSISMNSSVSSLSYVLDGADFYYSSELAYSAGATGVSMNYPQLGPTYLDVDKNKNIPDPIGYVDFSGSTTVTPGVSYSTLSIADMTSFFSTDKDEFTNYSILITDGATTHYRYITSYDPSSYTITLNSSFTTGVSTTSVYYRIIQNYRFAYVKSAEVGLSTLDPNRYIPYSPIAVSTLATGATAAVGSTGFVLATSYDLNVKVGDVLKVDSEDLLVNYVVGATGSLNISATRGYNSTTVEGHSIGATAYNKTDHRFKGWRLYVTSGPGSGQFTKITSYGATGSLGVSASYTLNSGSTGPTSNSTYWMVPDFAGTLNDGYYTTGATGISEIVISNPGVGYVSGSTGVYVSVSISSPPYGTRATAVAAVGATGAITSIIVTNPGTGYLFSPTVTLTQIGATSPTLPGYAYTNILNTNSPSIQVQDYSALGGVILSVPDATAKFVTAAATAELDPVNGTSVISCRIDNRGKGYTKVPSITFRKGGGSGAAASITLLNGEVNTITMTNLGLEYIEAPTVIFEESRIQAGEMVYQSSTGALGVVEYWDREKNLLYVTREPGSLEFDTSEISYNGINIFVNSVLGYYNTSGKRTTVLPEAEITVI